MPAPQLRTEEESDENEADPEAENPDDNTTMSATAAENEENEDETDPTDEVVEDVEGEEPEEETPEEDDEEEVAEATMPEETDEADADDDSGGILGSINTKTVILLAAVAVVGVFVAWLLRSGPLAGSGPATEEEVAEMEHEGGDDGEYNINAPDSDPLGQDGEMMGLLGMGENGQ